VSLTLSLQELGQLTDYNKKNSCNNLTESSKESNHPTRFHTTDQ